MVQMKGKHTEETKKKIYETRKRQERLGLTKSHNEEWRKNQSEKLMGHKSYETQKSAVSKAMKGVPKSEEHKRKLSERKKQWWAEWRKERESKV